MSEMKADKVIEIITKIRINASGILSVTVKKMDWKAWSRHDYPRKNESIKTHGGVSCSVRAFRWRMLMPEEYLKRKSIRLHYDDYSTTGAYLVTVCTHKRECIFGRIKNEQVVLNEIGKLARECWQDIPEHFRDLKLDACVVMPNHLHGIIIIQNAAGEPCRGPARGPSGSRKKALGSYF